MLQNPDNATVTSRSVQQGMTRVARIELYTELLEECDGEQPLLRGRRILDLTDVKEWLARRLSCELSRDMH